MGSHTTPINVLKVVRGENEKQKEKNKRGRNNSALQFKVFPFINVYSLPFCFHKIFQQKLSYMKIWDVGMYEINSSKHLIRAQTYTRLLGESAGKKHWSLREQIPSRLHRQQSYYLDLKNESKFLGSEFQKKFRSDGILHQSKEKVILKIESDPGKISELSGNI